MRRELPAYPASPGLSLPRRVSAARASAGRNEKRPEAEEHTAWDDLLRRAHESLRFLRRAASALALTLALTLALLLAAPSPWHTRRLRSHTAAVAAPRILPELPGHAPLPLALVAERLKLFRELVVLGAERGKVRLRGERGCAVGRGGEVGGYGLRFRGSAPSGRIFSLNVPQREAEQARAAGRRMVRERGEAEASA